MVAHLKADVIREVVEAVMQEDLDHPTLVASLHRGVQMRLKRGRDLGSIVQDLSTLNTTGRLDDGSLPLQVYLEMGLFMLKQAARAQSEGGKVLRGAIDRLLAAQTTGQGGPSFHWTTPASSFERITAGASSLLGIAWLEVGLAKSGAVARVRAAGGIGTAFLVAPGVLLTNHHVAFDPDSAAAQEEQVVVWFNHQEPAPGAHAIELLERTGIARPAEANREHDWALIRLAQPVALPVIALRPPPRPLEVDDRVCIIQHPEGGPKKISVHKNRVCDVNAGAGLVQYLTDTLGGSSGSPVFDARWDLVALHHAATSVRVDNDRLEHRNEGIAVEAVIRGIKAQCDAELCAALGL